MHTSNELFSTVPKEDYLSLFQKNNLQYPRVLEYLDFKKEDVARASGVPISSVRYDEKIPREVERRMNEWAVLLNLVAQHFKGDGHKTALWFTLRNPSLGNITPRDMIRFGRYEKLRKFVNNALAENKR